MCFCLISLPFLPNNMLALPALLLRESPLYEAPDHNLMDYCTNEATGKPRPNCSPLRQLTYMFDTAYKGNRGPVTVAIHSPYLKLR